MYAKHGVRANTQWYIYYRYYVLFSSVVICCEMLQQNAFPARFKGVYILNQPWYIDFLLVIIRRFLSEKMNERVSEPYRPYSFNSLSVIHLSNRTISK